MKKQVISNILEKLETQKASNQFFAKRTRASSYHKAIWNAKVEAFEKSIEICLEQASILDLRPSK